ncbi:MAG: sulfurtransferase [Microbacterium sp.]|uniref:sulfurtransferase n=1 Tax=Microbacterium sp. TaxID=51671 RepID=UPI001ACD1F84|nr:rhodanese-like domain-containing protein [Microbacterium sp.]MBN9178432.1 sulfurtransferase [Microbacterium sp.]
MPHLIDLADVRAALAGDRPVRLLDVRWRLDVPEGRPSYLAAHVPGAVYVDLERELASPGHPEEGRYPLPRDADLLEAARRWGLDDGDLVVAYDDNDSVAAARAWWLLRERGIDIRVLDGGIRAWVAGGLPVGSGDHLATRGSVTFTGAGPRIATIDDVARAPLTGVLLDVRAPGHYRGTVAGIDPAAGHIPGAINLPTTAYIDSRGGLRSPDEIRAVLRELDVDPTADIVLYCGTGIASAHSALALASAGIPPAIYPGAWTQWSRDRRRPVAVGPTPGDVFRGW